MEERAKGVLAEQAPWRPGIGWPIVAIQGLILVGVGIYVLAAKEDARDIVRQIIGGVLLFYSVLQILAGFRNRLAPAAPYLVLRGGIGGTVGLIVLLEPLSDYLDSDASRIILAFGALAYGLIALAGTVLARSEGEDLRIGALIAGGLWIIIAILFFTGDEEDNTRITTLGIVLIVIGALLLLYAAWLYRGAKSGEAVAAESQGT